jgi:hypothetical protein
MQGARRGAVQCAVDENSLESLNWLKWKIRKQLQLGLVIAPMGLESGPGSKPVAIWGHQNGARAGRDARLLANHVAFAVAVQFCSQRKNQVVRRFNSISRERPLPFHGMGRILRAYTAPK